jgi:putative NIF3 family GTP cyclohydrolase 1 type 2
MDIALDLAGFREIPADSEIHVAGKNLRKAIVAVDVDVGVLMLAKHLGADCVIAHHPAGGSAIIHGYRVFERHVDFMNEAGVPREVAERAVRARMSSLAMRGHIMDPDQLPRAAERLGLALLSVHSPADEVGRRIMNDRVEKLVGEVSSPKVRDVVERLKQIPELASATTEIDIRVGSPDSPAGKIVVSLAAFTNGGFEVADAYFEYGIGTVVYIHLLEPDLAKLQAKARGNLVVTGHISSDWIGLNRLSGVLQDAGLEVIRLGR